MRTEKQAIEDVVYYFLILVLAIFSAATAFLVSNLLLIFPVFLAYFTIIILGLVLGFLVAHFIYDIEHFTDRHHKSIWLVVFLGSLVGFLITYANSRISLVQPIVWTLVFAGSFILPLLTDFLHKNSSQHK